MEDPNSTLLPYVLETLSRKPQLCDTFDNILEEVEQLLIDDDNTCSGSNLRKALQRALKVGQSLGIVTLTDENIRMPFNFRSSAVKGPAKNAQQPANDIGSRSASEMDVMSAAAKMAYHKTKHNHNVSRSDSDFSLRPPVRGARRVRGRPRGRSYARRGTVRRARSGRVGRRRRRSSGNRRRMSRRRY